MTSVVLNMYDVPSAGPFPRHLVCNCKEHPWFFGKVESGPTKTSYTQSSRNRRISPERKRGIGKRIRKGKGGQEGSDKGSGRARGYDAGKKIQGRKRHLIVDTLGLIMALAVHPADVQDRDGGKLLIEQLGTCFRRLKVIFADGGYAGKFVHWAKGWYGRTIEIVKRTDAGKFVVLPKRWSVERPSRGSAGTGDCRRTTKRSPRAVKR